MTTDRADYSPNMAGRPVSIDELFRDVPVQSADDLACAGVFDTDEELDEFLKYIYAARRADLA
ncbi:MAG: hypothetical protein ACT4NY_09565 [Pseudonocardiales bacterium]